MVSFLNFDKGIIVHGLNMRENEGGGGIVLNIWQFSSSPPPTSEICMGFGKQIRNGIFHRYLKNAFLNGQEF